MVDKRILHGFPGGPGLQLRLQPSVCTSLPCAGPRPAVHLEIRHRQGPIWGTPGLSLEQHPTQLLGAPKTRRTEKASALQGRVNFLNKCNDLDQVKICLLKAIFYIYCREKSL